MDFYTPKQVKEILQIGQAFTYELFNSKSFPSFKAGEHWRVKKSDFEKWVEEQKKNKG